MGIALQNRLPSAPTAEWNCLPPVMRVLYIANPQRTGGWLAEAFSTDDAANVRMQEVVGGAAGLARLRDESFDAVMVSHEPGELNALELIEGYRASGSNEPIIVLGHQSEQEMSALCYEVGADAYICAHTCTTRSLVWIVGRAVQRHLLVQENRRLTLAEQQRLQREHDEAERLLSQQRGLIADLESIQQAGTSATSVRIDQAGSRDEENPRRRPNLPHELILHYRELLRTYVIMGSGNLASDLSRLADLLATAGITARQTMELHIHVLEELVRGLGSRSTRHVMTRADLLVLEIMVHLAENYRRRYRQRVQPPTQRMLPGFEETGSVAF